MAKRPLNRCLQCGHTWYPRGSDRSVRCPACGVQFTSWETEEERGGRSRPSSTASGPVLAVCVGVAVIFVLCAGGVAVFNGPGRAAKEKADRPDEDKAPVEKAKGGNGPPPPNPRPNPDDPFEAVLSEFRANAATAERKYKGRTVTVNGVVHSANWFDKKSMGPHVILSVGGERDVVATFFGRTQVDDVLALKSGQPARITGQILNGTCDKNGVVTVAVDHCQLLSPLASSPTPVTPSAPPVPAPVTVAVAPDPRRVANHPPADTATPWVRNGPTETRVAGVRVARPVLVDTKGREYVAPDPVLLVWVETRRLSGGPIELRRWIGPLESAAVLSAGGSAIEPARFVDARPSGQLDRGVAVLPGEAGVTDVLAFRVPGTAAQTLTLRLAAAHARADDSFSHTIPASAWKK